MSLFAFLTPKWWIERGKRRLEERFEGGWNWAAGELLRGATAEDVERPSDAAATFGDEDAWDEGVRAAVRAWQEDEGMRFP